MERLYFKYRYFQDNRKNRYSPSYQYNLMFSDRVESWDVKIFDLEISEEDYLTPKRFWYCEFDSTKISKEDLTYDLRDLPNHIRVCADNTEARNFLLEFTDQRSLREISTNKFELRWVSEWMEWEIIPAKFLIIN